MISGKWKNWRKPSDSCRLNIFAKNKIGKMKEKNLENMKIISIIYISINLMHKINFAKLNC